MCVCVCVCVCVCYNGIRPCSTFQSFVRGLTQTSSLIIGGVQLVHACTCIPSLVPRPSTPPVFDRLQQSKTGGVEGLCIPLLHVFALPRQNTEQDALLDASSL